MLQFGVEYVVHAINISHRTTIVKREDKKIYSKKPNKDYENESPPLEDKETLDILINNANDLGGMKEIPRD